MSDFEGRALPLLADPVQGVARTFSPMDQIEIAAWAFKTTCMLDCSWPGGRVIPDSHFRYLFRFRLPPRNIHIWLSAYNARDGEPFHSFRGIRTGRDVTSPRMPRRPRYNYRFAITLGHLVFYLFSYIGADETDYDPALVLGTTVGGKPNMLSNLFHAVWPIYELNVAWPTLMGFGSSSLDSFMRARTT